MTHDTHTRTRRPLPLAMMGIVAIVLSLVGVWRHVSADGVDWPRALPSIVTLVSSIWFVWTVRRPGFAARPVPTLSAVRYARLGVAVFLGACAAWLGWVTFQQSPVNIYNLGLIGVLLVGVVFFLSRPLLPRGV